MSDQYSVHEVTRVRRSASPPSPYEVNGLPPGSHLEDRGPDGGVWLIQPPTVITDAEGKPKPVPDRIETRVDSRADQELIKRGGSPWYLAHLEKGRKAK